MNEAHNSMMVDKAAELFNSISNAFTTYSLDINHLAICGGFVRDFLLDRKIRDIDMYVRKAGAGAGAGMSGKWQSDWDGWLKEHPEFSVIRNDDYVETKPGVLCEAYRSEDSGQEILLLDSIRPASFVANHFDYGICQAVLFRNGRIKTSEHFERDVKDKTITMLVRDYQTDAEIGRSIKYHLPRLKKKYEDYSLHVNHDTSFSSCVIKDRP